jgi:hypothetical protein
MSGQPRWIQAPFGGNYKCQVVDRPCPKCGAQPNEPCQSGGYFPVGELPGDPRVGIHKERRRSDV